MPKLLDRRKRLEGDRREEGLRPVGPSLLYRFLSSITVFIQVIVIVILGVAFRITMEHLIRFVLFVAATSGVMLCAGSCFSVYNRIKFLRMQEEQIRSGSAAPQTLQLLESAIAFERNRLARYAVSTVLSGLGWVFVVAMHLNFMSGSAWNQLLPFVTLCAVWIVIAASMQTWGAVRLAGDLGSLRFPYGPLKNESMPSVEGHFATPGVESIPGICGGEPVIVRTRIPVWLLEQARRLGSSEAEILRTFPTLQAEDLANAWAYVRLRRGDIEMQIRENEGA